MIQTLIAFKSYAREGIRAALAPPRAEDIINLMTAEAEAIGWRIVSDQQFVLSL